MANLNWMEACLAGGELDDANVAELEVSLARTPDDLELRVRQLGALSRRRLPRGQAILWLVRHHPEIDLGGFVFMARKDDASHYDAIRQAWDDHMMRAPDNPSYIKRAAEFAQHDDSHYAETLLRRGAQLEPTISRWPGSLGHLLLRRSLASHDAEERRAASTLALREFQRAYDVEPWEFARHGFLIYIARAAAATGHLERAAAAATQVLAEAVRYENTWQYGNAIHWAHIVLGDVALARGETALSARELVLAGQTRGSPQLNSFGPDFRLARALLIVGEREAVLTYFSECGRFWELDGGRLATWTKDVERGQTPDFSVECAADDAG